MTLVWSRWNTDEWLSWLKSIDTFGWSVTPRMPFKRLAGGPLDRRVDLVDRRLASWR